MYEEEFFPGVSPLPSEEVTQGYEPSRWRALTAGLALSSVLLSGCMATPNHETHEEGSGVAPESSASTMATTPSEAPSATVTPSSESTLAAAPEHAPTQRGLDDERFSKYPVWEQDFTKMPDGPIDTSVWSPLTGLAPANKEVEHYTDKSANVRVQDGKLIIEAREQDGEYTSARLQTEGITKFQYGKFEVTATLPEGIGTWPAVWLYPDDGIYRKEHPAAVSEGPYIDGEMDILEAVGAQPHTVYGIAHSLELPKSGTYYETVKLPDNDTIPHTYGLEWTPTSLLFSIDGKPYYRLDKQSYYTYKQWPYDQPYDLIANLALGGQWGGILKDKYPPDGIAPGALPAQMTIESIKYYSYEGK